MKIALVILHADPARGGAERYTVDLAAALARRGHDVALVHAAWIAPRAIVRHVVGKPYRQILLKAGGLTRTWRYRVFLKSLEDYLKHVEEFDVVHAMLPVRRCEVYHPHAGMAAQALVTTGWRSVFNPRRKLFAEVEGKLMAGPRRPVALCLSDYVKAEVLRHYPTFPAQRFATLFNAVDLDRFQPAATRPTRDYVNGLFIGQDFERKGLMAALLAASMLKEPRLKITVVGRRNPGFHPPPDAGAQVSFAGEVSDPRPF
ncbi:MAG: glycosyltransferase, partial [Tepidisphaeraceae bacterium]